MPRRRRPIDADTYFGVRIGFQVPVQYSTVLVLSRTSTVYDER
jgi:hypothetical protein